jgi:hypothetical protein
MGSRVGVTRRFQAVGQPDSPRTAPTLAHHVRKVGKRKDDLEHRVCQRVFLVVLQHGVEEGVVQHRDVGARGHGRARAYALREGTREDLDLVRGQWIHGKARAASTTLEGRRRGGRGVKEYTYVHAAVVEQVRWGNLRLGAVEVAVPAAPHARGEQRVRLEVRHRLGVVRLAQPRRRRAHRDELLGRLVVRGLLRCRVLAPCSCRAAAVISIALCPAGVRLRFEIARGKRLL